MVPNLAVLTPRGIRFLQARDLHIIRLKDAIQQLLREREPGSKYQLTMSVTTDSGEQTIECTDVLVDFRALLS